MTRFIKKKLFALIFILSAASGIVAKFQSDSDSGTEKIQKLQAELDATEEKNTTKTEKKKEKGTSQDNPKSECDRVMTDVTLNRVVDGDTLEVTGTDGTVLKVRMIGMDTPESVSSNQNKNSEYGKIASDYTKKILKEGSVLYLEYTDKKNDQYGRELAYVWTKNTGKRTDKEIKKYCVNAKLVAQGYARPYFEQDNRFYKDNFRKYFKLAKKQKRGLFQYGSESKIWK